MNEDKLKTSFSTALGLPLDQIRDDLTYATIKEWDSIGHMALVAELEGAFEIVFEIDDIIAMSTVAKAREILGKYGVAF